MLAKVIRFFSGPLPLMLMSLAVPPCLAPLHTASKKMEENDLINRTMLIPASVRVRRQAGTVCVLWIFSRVFLDLILSFSACTLNPS